jgi:hypothetical protein
MVYYNTTLPTRLLFYLVSHPGNSKILLKNCHGCDKDLNEKWPAGPKTPLARWRRYPSSARDGPQSKACFRRTGWIVTIAIEAPHHNTGMLGLDDMLSFNGERPRRRFNRYIFSIKYIMFLWRNYFDNIGTRTWRQYHCVKRPCQGEFLADSQAIMTSAVTPFCTALHRGSRSRITRLSVKLGPTGTGNFRQFDRDIDLKLK